MSKRTKKDFDRQNELNKQRYDQYTLMMPKGMKNEVIEASQKLSISMREYINSAIKDKLDKENRS